MNNGIFPFYDGINLRDGKSKYYFMLLKRIFEGDYALEQVELCYCGRRELEVLSTQDRFALPFGTKICRYCGLIQLSPRISSRSLPNYYNEIYQGLILGDSCKELTTEDKAEDIYNYLEKYAIGNIKDKEITIIEIGCGSGVKLNGVAVLCGKNGIKVRALGCDYSASAKKMACARNIDCRLGNAASLIGEKADIVMLSHVIEHFVDIKAEFKVIKKLLNEGAYLYVEAPGVGDLINRKEYGYNYLIYSVMAHMYNFNLTSLRSVIEPLGFEFIAGDEYIHSIFRFNPSYCGKLDLSQNYTQVMAMLEAAENKRKKIALTYKSKIKNCIRTWIRGSR